MNKHQHVCMCTTCLVTLKARRGCQFPSNWNSASGHEPPCGRSAGSQTWVLCRSSKCSQLLSRLSSLMDSFSYQITIVFVLPLTISHIIISPNRETCFFFILCSCGRNEDCWGCSVSITDIFPFSGAHHRALKKLILLLVIP